MNMFKKNGGFTLVELIVVIAILAILAGIAVPAYSGYLQSAEKAGDITALSAVKTAAVAAMATTGEVKEIYVDASADDGVITSIKVGPFTVKEGDPAAEVTKYVYLVGSGEDALSGDVATKAATAFGDYVDVSDVDLKFFEKGAKWTNTATEWTEYDAE